MDAPTCIRCGKRHWSREACAVSVANAAITNAVLEHIEHRKRVANAPVANVANADVANSDERVLRPRRGDREKYNARQREYVRKRRAK